MCHPVGLKWVVLHTSYPGGRHRHHLHLGLCSTTGCGARLALEWLKSDADQLTCFFLGSRASCQKAPPKTTIWGADIIERNEENTAVVEVGFGGYSVILYPLWQFFFISIKKGSLLNIHDSMESNAAMMASTSVRPTSQRSRKRRQVASDEVGVSRFHPSFFQFIFSITFCKHVKVW